MGVGTTEEGMRLHCWVSLVPPLPDQSVNNRTSTSHATQPQGLVLLQPPPGPPPHTHHTHTSNAKRMPTDIQESLRTITMRHGGLSKEEAEQFLRTLETTRRLQLETWA